MSIERYVENKIHEYLVEDGCSERIARQAAQEGRAFFNQCNHKDPFYESLCHAGIRFAQALEPKYKFKKLKPANAKPFVNQKPRSRKHKSQQALI
ncbi:hypothetical protein [Vibrio sp. 1978]|uniref:hypothetical protein n=1 Tax=Vibrio sp. 1978 TaxID=3074585 RepID=UPI002966DC4C|nr:hypothetical protein [Vibrio sp. 1978]MDW3058695.1 hypothetical protein [Vibrio sp. 1978]